MRSLVWLSLGSVFLVGAALAAQTNTDGRSPLGDYDHLKFYSKPDVVSPPRSDPKQPNAPQEVYPALSTGLGEEGAVVLLIAVNEDGEVTEANVDTTSGSTRLDSVAVKKAKTWRFIPGTVNGEAAAMTFKFKVTFKAL